MANRNGRSASRDAMYIPKAGVPWFVWMMMVFAVVTSVLIALGFHWAGS